MINTACNILGIDRDKLNGLVRRELNLSDTQKLTTDDFRVILNRRLDEFVIKTEPFTPLAVTYVVEPALHNFLQDFIHDMLIDAFVGEVVLNDFNNIGVPVDAYVKDSFDFSLTLSKDRLTDRVVQRMSHGIAESFSQWLNTYHPHLGLIPTTLSLQQVAHALDGFGLDGIVSASYDENGGMAFTINTLRLMSNKEGLVSAHRLFHQYISSCLNFEAEIFSVVRSIVADHSMEYSNEARVTAVSLSQDDEPETMSYEDYFLTIAARPI